MRVAITGGTGTVGRHVAGELARRGHEVLVLTRGAPARLPAGAVHRRVDLITGDGLPAALESVDAVVDAANGGPRRAAAEAVLVGGTSKLLAAERAAGVGHHVALSIVGADRVPWGYYEVKVAQEGLVRAADVPWTIVRATQFHALLDSTLRSVARFGVLPGAAIVLQPVDEREVAVVLTDTVQAGPSGATTQFAGPERRTAREFAHTWRLETGRRAVLVPVPLAGRAARALRAGGLTDPGAWTGRTTFAEWLRRRAAAGADAPSQAAGQTAGSAA